MNAVILFVCTGNVCRSPMAAGLFRAHAQRNGDGDWLVAESAGTWAWAGDAASANAIATMAERGIDLSNHRARAITKEMMARAAVVLVMERGHLEALAVEFPEHRRKIHLMSELGGRVFDIADPFRGTLAEYQDCAQELQDLIETGYEKIKTWLNDSPTPS